MWWYLFHLTVPRIFVGWASSDFLISEGRNMTPGAAVKCCAGYALVVGLCSSGLTEASFVSSSSRRGGLRNHEALEPQPHRSGFWHVSLPVKAAAENLHSARDLAAQGDTMTVPATHLQHVIQHQQSQQGDRSGEASEVAGEEHDGGDVFFTGCQDGTTREGFFDNSYRDDWTESEDARMDNGCFESSESAYRYHTCCIKRASPTRPRLLHPTVFNSHMSQNRQHQHHRRRLHGAQHLSAVPGMLVKGTAWAAVVIAVIAPLVKALSSHWPYFVAGSICAAVSHTAAVPLDVLKTRIQCAAPGEYRGPWDALATIMRSEGAQVLFGGAGATLVGYAMQGFLKFGFFEFLKPFFATFFNAGGVASGQVLSSLIAASVVAEVVGSSALTPLEATRIRMVSDTSYAPGLRTGIARMISEEGLGSLSRGLPAVLAKQIPYTVTKLVTFDMLTRSALSGNGRRSGGVGVTAACAVAAGILSSLASQPGDSLLSTLNSERSTSGEGGERREPVAVAMARIARKAGFFGLFRGAGARMLHVTAIVTLQLLIYQSVKDIVGITS